MTYSCAIDCDEYPAVYHQTVRTRQKPGLLCSLCHLPVKPRDRYVDCQGLYEGDWVSHQPHEDCHVLMMAGAKLICGDSSYVWDVDLDETAAEMLALTFRTPDDAMRDWIIRYGDLLERHGLFGGMA